MRIPKSYMLADNKINVVLSNDLYNLDTLGLYLDDKNLIKLQSASENVAEDKVELTFYHELVHSILRTSRYLELNKDEDFVDRFALLLKQAINTMEFDNE